jgi:ketosteroid isomerase-like protein
MDTTKRRELVEQYFSALDAESYDELRPVFDQEAEYLYPDENPITGLDNIVTFFRERRPTGGTDHEVTRWVHNEDVTVAEGHVTGMNQGIPFEGYFCDVVEFDAEEDSVTSIAVYSRSDADT